VIPLSIWILSQFTSPEVLLLLIGLSAEAVRQLKLSGAVEEQ
jgi:hypothetical protein